MSYVPPHLRNSGPTTTTKISSVNLDNGRTNLSFSSSSSSNSSLSSPSSNAFRRSSASSVPNSVLPQWQPSERVLRMKPDQIEDVRLRLNVDVTVASDSSPALAPIESFTDMCLHQSIMKDIAIHGYTTPTPIQAQAMPVALSGRDMLGCAETGSGKTAAFSIPMIQHCLAQPPVCRGDGPLALVLAPTRELAQQIEKEVKAFSRSLESFKTAIVVGGTNIYEQRSELKAGVDIVVATPGRFIDHLQQGNTSLSRVSFVVLDEADRMLDMGFEPQIREVMRSLPEKHQTLLFSATMPVEIEALAQELNESRTELLNRIQGLKQDLQSWRSKLDTQVKTYRDELSELKKSLNVEVDQLRSEFQELRTTLQQQQDDVSSSLRTLGLQDVSGDPKDAQAQDPKVEDDQDGLVLPRQMDYDVSGDAKDAQAQDPKVEEDDKEELVLPKKLEYDEGSEN